MCTLRSAIEEADALGAPVTVVVPAGTYTLKSDFCQGTASVTAGKQTHADTLCLVP